MRRLLHGLLAFSLLVFAAVDARSDELDDYIREQMRRRQIPGLSLAVIQGQRIIKVKSYGVTQKGGTSPVTPSTLFQAGSISKSVAAVGALRLVDQGQLSLDEDVNAKLRTWKVPPSEHAAGKKITLRGLLSHTAGLTVHGFPGYEVDGPVPTLVQILDGEAPANTAAIRVDLAPGSRWRYSGGGYTVMQQLILDVTNQPYPAYMREAVLLPLGMAGSTFEQPLTKARAQSTAAGHGRDRSVVKNRWHIYPEMAAAGLWTTAVDLARFAVGVQKAYAGQPGAVLSQKTAREMLADAGLKSNYGLGFGVAGEGRTLRFSHGGRDEGFDAMLMAYAETGQGAVVMINANDNSRFVSQILDAVARKYGWPGYAAPTPAKRVAAPVAAKALDAYAGRYEFANNQMIAFSAQNGRLMTLVDDFEDEEFVPAGATRFVSADRDAEITFVKDNGGAITGLVWKSGKEQRKVPRIGPLVRQLTTQPDPDAERTRAVEAALRAFAEGGQTVESAPGIAPGARRAFARGAGVLKGIKSLSFVAAQDVQGRGIERHEGSVARVLYYKITSDDATRHALVYLTAEGLVTDYDVVND